MPSIVMLMSFSATEMWAQANQQFGITASDHKPNEMLNHTETSKQWRKNLNYNKQTQNDELLQNDGNKPKEKLLVKIDLKDAYRILPIHPRGGGSYLWVVRLN